MTDNIKFAFAGAPEFGGSPAALLAGRDSLCANTNETEYTLMT